MKRGQTIMISLVFAMILFAFGILFLNLIVDDVITAREPTNLNCTGFDSISDGAKVACLMTDGVVPYAIVLILSISVGSLIGRFAI